MSTHFFSIESTFYFGFWLPLVKPDPGHRGMADSWECGQLLLATSGRHLEPSSDPATGLSVG
jgi:hypothetical protein